MKEDWDAAINFVLKQEGGWCNDPNDSGGETFMGISRKNFPTWEGWETVDGMRSGRDFPQNVNENAYLLDRVKLFYRQNFWNACHCDDLPTNLAIAVMDCGVNQGTNKARRILQIALGVDVDGNIGAATVAAAAKSGKAQVKRFLAERLADYSRIIMQNPKDLVFALNWSMRVLSLAEIVLP